MSAEGPGLGPSPAPHITPHGKSFYRRKATGLPFPGPPRLSTLGFPEAPGRAPSCSPSPTCTTAARFPSLGLPPRPGLSYVSHCVTTELPGTQEVSFLVAKSTSCLPQLCRVAARRGGSLGRVRAPVPVDFVWMVQPWLQVGTEGLHSCPVVSFPSDRLGFAHSVRCSGGTCLQRCAFLRSRGHGRGAFSFPCHLHTLTTLLSKAPHGPVVTRVHYRPRPAL